MAAGCKYLYFYDDEDSGARYMGCLNKVFDVEIDVEVFGEAERTRHGYGGVKLTGRPIPVCRVTVEQAYEGHGDAFQCVKLAFFTAAVDVDAAAALALRFSLEGPAALLAQVRHR